jgi:hypothetical protein
VKFSTSLDDAILNVTSISVSNISVAIAYQNEPGKGCNVAEESAPESARDSLASLGRIMSALARDVSTLAASTALARKSDPRRVLPEISPATAWRVFPRLLRSTAQFMPTAAQREFALNLANDIEGREKAEVSNDR